MAGTGADDSDYEGRPHGPIDLPDLVTGITLDGVPFDARDVQLRLDEALDVELRWTGALKPSMKLIDQELRVSFEGGTNAEFLMTGHKLVFNADHEEFVAVSRLAPLVLKGKSKGVAGAALLNGPVLHPKVGTLLLEYGNHRAEISPYEHFSSINTGSLGGIGGRMITHSVVIRSVNGKPLKVDKVIEFLGRVCGFLGFAKGTRVGFGQVRNHARRGFRTLGFSRTDRLYAPNNWFHWHLTDQLPALFAAYMDLMESPAAKRSVGRAFAYYKTANLTRLDSIEAAMIMSMAGLETLAAHVLATRGGWTQNMLRNISLAEQVRACTCLLGIDGDPTEGSDFLAKGLRQKPGQPMRDGFLLLSEFRNGVTHPTPFHYDTDIFHAWDAAQWLLEMQLLVVLGYGGRYQDRRRQRRSFAGDLSRMPVRDSSTGAAT